MRETGVVRFNIDGDREEAKKYYGVARTLLGQLKLQMQVNKLQVLSRTLVLDGSVVIAVLSLFGQDTIAISVPEVVEASAPVAEEGGLSLLGVGWAQQANSDFSRGLTGVMASTFDQLSTVLTNAISVTLPGWLLGSLNFLDCDRAVFAGALSGSVTGVFALGRGLYFTFDAATSTPGTPQIFPSVDGKVIVTSTPGPSGPTTTHAIHQHTPIVDVHGVLHPNTQYVGTISAGTGFSASTHSVPVFDRELFRAVWWGFDSDFSFGAADDGTLRTILTASAMDVPSGEVSTYGIEVLAATVRYTDAVGDPYVSDPAIVAQTLADIPASSVRPSNDARPWWVNRQVRRVGYSRGIDQNISSPDLPLGAHAVLWSRDTLMRGDTVVFAPDGTDLDNAHLLDPVAWGANTANGIIAFVYRKVALVQDVRAPDIPDDDFWPPGVAHPVTLNGEKVYRQAIFGTDPNAGTSYTLFLAEGNGISYSAPLSGSTYTVNIHANGQAILVGDGPSSYLLEKSGGAWVRKLIAGPAAVNAVGPAFATSNTQYTSVSFSDGTFGFQLYAFAFSAKGPNFIDVYLTKKEKQLSGSWVYSESKINTVSITLLPQRMTTLAFRAFGALRPYLL